MKLTNKTILITGASSGIGRAVAIALSKRQNNLIITARRQDLLSSLEEEIQSLGSRCLQIPCDALDEEAAEKAVLLGVDAFSRIDAALLNIGDGPSFSMATVDAKDIKQNMQINYDTMVNYLVPLIKQMKQQNDGIIAQTNSLAGFLGIPMQGPYSSAKAAGRILFDTCRLELKSNNVRFCSLHSGFVATEKVAEDGIPAPFEMSEEQAAQHIIHGMEKEMRDYLFPFPLRWLIRLARVLPKPIAGYLLLKGADKEY